MTCPPLFQEYLEKLKIPLEKKMALSEKQAAPFFKALAQCPTVTPSRKDYSQATVTIGIAEDINPTDKLQLIQILNLFRPWRKGPFSLFGIEIDAEWRSDFKWNRIAPLLGDLSHKRICDVGCGNGYFMYRLLSHHPELVLGLDPTWRYYVNFLVLQHYAQEPNLLMLPLGWQELALLKDSFDILLVMGIVYHHRNPIAVLENCLRALVKKGIAIVESMTLPGEEPLAFCPPKQYANVKGVWFIPTASGLAVWLKKVGFRNIQCVSHIPLTTAEQRRTAWAEVPSLKESLTPDGKQTKEGFPTPWRTIFIAQR